MRQCESTSALLADRRRAETETRQDHAPTLSQLLLERWRAGDWAVLPEDVIEKL
ncbi:MAG: hypothetical protein ABWY51_06395 [Gaiellaceae bacterium]